MEAINLAILATDQISLVVVISSFIGFVILFLVLKQFLWGPVLGMIDERRDSIEAAYREVEDARADVAQMKSDYETRIAEINSEAQAKMQEAIDKGKQVADEIRQSAEESRTRMLAKTEEDIEREKNKAIEEIRQTAIGLSFDIAERALKQDLDRERHDKLVSTFISDMKEIS